ncbi:MAG: hypothetical protein Ct9H300mP4_17970 [Gammaproteobacteria bacterium]|nr:MAG: hypothetical protein Ct9H300mP4_17970 [Gammaproteobacteria bacterium]
MVNGDYSGGKLTVIGLKNGKIWAYPVSEVTVAGNLKDMLMQITAVGNDPEKNGSIYSGSILMEKLNDRRKNKCIQD